ncbi:ABC transporter ATP-binding protein [Streptomyces sp. SBT349]|uniref:ABC transporter ATP-binding protein n=1 Tax=Streptomyces sp. SBT349 TaxID=1580539 RepID=UPI0007C695A7|nr:ATP-binding cassette domain-containing protein [Streptomyces sp. SBT349]
MRRARDGRDTGGGRGGPGGARSAGRLRPPGWWRRRERPGGGKAAETVLRLDGVSHGYGARRVLDAVALEVAPGECVALLGENGSGKSTLLRLAAGRECPSGGTVTFRGAAASEDDPGFRAAVATVLESGACYPDLSVREHLALVALAHGLGAAADAAVERALAEHRLTGRAEARPAELSSGQTQLLALAAAWVRPAGLLILDEPEQRLDVAARRALARRLAEAAAGGTAVLLATHDRGLADEAADRAFVLAEGRLTDHLGRDRVDAGPRGPRGRAGARGQPVTRSLTSHDPARERTAHTLDHLRALRAGQRRRDRRGTAYTVYCTLLIGATWGVPYLLAAARAAESGSLRGPTADLVLATLPATAPALAACALLTQARQATWRGPVRLDAAAVTWLLPQPLLRRRLLLPRFVASACFSAAAGALLGGVLGLLLHAAGGGPLGGAVAAGAWAGAATALLGTALGTLVQRHPAPPGAPAGLLAAARWGVAALVVLAAVSVAREEAVAGTAALWTGPWGWAALPLVACAGGTGWTAGALGALLSAGALAAALAAAVSAVPALPARVLRAQAGTARRVTASLYALDLRQARSTVRASMAPGVRAVALPAPRSRALVVAWRDATALLRAPGRPLWAVLWSGAAVLAAGAGTAPASVVLLALPAGYLAAAQLLEPARLESDDPRRGANLPWTAGGLALRHGAVAAAILPALLLLALSALATVPEGVGAGARAWEAPSVLLLLSVPALVGAALVSAARGVLPTHLLIGADTPLGNTGPMQAALWYLRGPLVVLALLAPPFAASAGADAGGGLGAVRPAHAVWCLATGAAALWWAGRAAGRAARAVS